MTTIRIFFCCLLLFVLRLTLAIDWDNYACTNMTFDENGKPDITATLWACSRNMQDPDLPISYLKDYSGYITVYSQYVLNNLISINEVQNLVSLDFYYRLVWEDKRWQIPELWNYVDEHAYFEGIDIAELVTTVPFLPFWLPDITFRDVTNRNVFASTIKLFPNGTLYWSRHFAVTLMQPNFQFKHFPLDYQDIVIKSESYGLSTRYCQINYRSPPVTYISDEDQVSFTENPIWSHKKGDYTASVREVDLTLNPAFPRFFEVGHVTLQVERASDGILIRFALPILVLLTLAGITFWAQYAGRTPTTMTLLLSVSALYVTVMSNIPMVGYMTTFDRWILAMYAILSICVAIHQLVTRLLQKVDVWPMRSVYIRMLEMVGRAGVVPVAVIAYLTAFAVDKESTTYITTVTVVCAISICVLTKEVFGIIKAVRIALMKVELKLRQPDRFVVSSVEKQIHKCLYQTMLEGKHIRQSVVNEILKSMEMTSIASTTTSPVVSLAQNDSSHHSAADNIFRAVKRESLRLNEEDGKT